MIKIGIVGIGRQGSKYVTYLKCNSINNARLAAVCDINPERFAITESVPDCKTFTDYKEMLSPEYIDAVIIDTPHYLHPVIALYAVKQGIHVLSDKPLGVDALTVKKIEPYLAEKQITFGVLFNQRMMPLFQRIKSVVENREMGKLKRCIWEITDWYRPQKYYDIGDWRSSWKGEGGGVLINQCVHNIDMICYLFGVPRQVSSNIGYGVYHRTEIDDSVAAELIYDNGFVCTLISSTGETPGTNRMELSGTKGKMVFDEFDKLKFYINDIPEDVFSETVESPRYTLKFGKPGVQYFEEKINDDIDQHKECIQDFVDAVLSHRQPSASYHDGLNCVETINAIYYSDWTDSRVGVPVNEDDFFQKLKEKW